jgi:hypothetical protein
MNRKPLYIAIAIYLLVGTAILTVSLYLNQGHFVYALDDAYIHMDMAKNLVMHGKFGTNGMDFTSASSSPLWVLLLSAVYYVFGVSIVAPFFLNILFQIFSLYIAFQILKESHTSPSSRWLLTFLLAFVFITPFFTALFSAMEHSAQIAFALLFAFLSSKLISGDEDKGLIKYLVLITPILTGLRYESMFLVLVVSFLLLLRKKYIFSISIFGLGLLPVLIYGIVSLSHGWYFFPNSILLKSPPPDYSVFGMLKFFHNGFKNITQAHILLLLIIAFFLYGFNYIKKGDLWSWKQVFLLVSMLTTIFNLGMIRFHQNGWFYRYDAYLMAIGITAIAVNLSSLWGGTPADQAAGMEGRRGLLGDRIRGFAKYIVLILSWVIISPFIFRAFTLFQVPLATNNIYDQHYQMAQFVRDYGYRINLAANDIGMINFYSDSRILDLYGLTDMDVARSKFIGKYSTDVIENLITKGNIRLAIVYANGYDMYGGLPPSWIKIGEWTMTNYNVVCGYETVTFFSITKEDEEGLRKKLNDFSQHLPPSVAYINF